MRNIKKFIKFNEEIVIKDPGSFGSAADKARYGIYTKIKKIITSVKPAIGKKYGTYSSIIDGRKRFKIELMDNYIEYTPELKLKMPYVDQPATIKVDDTLKITPKSAVYSGPYIKKTEVREVKELYDMLFNYLKSIIEDIDKAEFNNKYSNNQTLDKYQKDGKIILSKDSQLKSKDEEENSYRYKTYKDYQNAMGFDEGDEEDEKRVDSYQKSTKVETPKAPIPPPVPVNSYPGFGTGGTDFFKD